MTYNHLQKWPVFSTIKPKHVQIKKTRNQWQNVRNRDQCENAFINDRLNIIISNAIDFNTRTTESSLRLRHIFPGLDYCIHLTDNALHELTNWSKIEEGAELEVDKNKRLYGNCWSVVADLILI